MGIAIELIRELARELTNVPTAGDFHGRTTLLAGVHAQVTRNQHHALSDFMGILGDLDRVDPPSLLVLIDNALMHVGEGALSQRLNALRQRVEQAIRGPAVAPPPPPPTPSHGVAEWGGARLRRLREVLAQLYPSGSRARIVCADVGIPLGKVNFGGSAQEVWFGMTEQAQNHGLLDALLRYALEEYTHNPELRALAQGNHGE